MIEALSPTRQALAKETGALVADILQTLKTRSAVGTNLLDIDGWAETMILAAGAVSCYVDYAPSFTGCRTTTRWPTATCCPSTSPSP